MKRKSDPVDDQDNHLPHQPIPSPKRPRIDTRPTRTIFCPLRTPSDIEDIGIVVSSSDPGPSSGSLLRHRPLLNRLPVTPSTPVVNPLQPDYSSPYIPPAAPLINRHTLRELDLDVIIRNPMLRHDLLFDSGLQFRPRRKLDLSEKYWNAVWKEVQTGCTCVTLEYTSGKPIKTVCMCSRLSEPPTSPIAYLLSSFAYTIRMPSRVRILLIEFLQVMLFVIQPLSNTAVYSNPNDVREQAKEHSQHAAYIKEIFDPAFIFQELSHKVFSPSGLFLHIGELLKNHCAPMRDRSVDQLMDLAQQPGFEGLKAFRSCLELLEQMKLDIANHQLSQLRPWLLRNTGSFEMKAFKMRFGPEPSLHATRQWLYSTHNSLMQRTRAISHPAYPEDIVYRNMTRNQQVYVSVLRGIVDLVFDSCISSPSASKTTPSVPPTPIDMSSPATPVTPISPLIPPTTSRPETLYLDKTRLATFSTEAANVTVMYMFMLLFRQLAFINLGDGASTRPAKNVDAETMMQLRQELLDIGPSRMAACFLPAEVNEGLTDKQKKDLEQRRNIRSNLALQVAKKAYDLRKAACLPRAELSDSSAVKGELPDQRLVNIAVRWVETHMQLGSNLSVMLHNRVREVLFDLVVSLAYPAKDVSLAAVTFGRRRSTSGDSTSSSAPSSPKVISSTPTSTTVPPAPEDPFPHLPKTLIKEVEPFRNRVLNTPSSNMHTPSPAMSTLPRLKIDLLTTTRQLATADAITENHQPGMEAILEDSRELAEKLARLALIHLNTFLGMYESDGFLVASNENPVDKWTNDKWKGRFGNR